MNSTSLTGATDPVRIYPLSDNSAVYVISTQTSTSVTYTWKYSTSSPNNAYWQEITGITNGAMGQAVINDNQIFILGITATYTLRMMKITFGNTSIDWGNKINCPLATCSLSLSFVVLSNDKSKAYWFPVYVGSSQFITLNLSDGSVSGQRYISNQAATIILSSRVIDNYLATLILWTSDTIISIFNIATELFTNTQIKTGYTIKDINKEPINGR